ncbi:MAG: hypothetical protein K2G95_06965, partial [Muribaculaceae bacterium]|nr:hypothetical protein [Muribaculaceae bacterium]
FGTDLTQEQIDNLPPKFRACYDPDKGSGVIGKQCEFWYMGHLETGICKETHYLNNEWNGWPRCSNLPHGKL